MRGSGTSAPVPVPAPMSVPAPWSVPAPALISTPAATADGAEQLPRYKPPPPYERIAKADEPQPVEMQDLERCESFGTTASRSGDPPGYQAAAKTSDGGERVSVRRIDTDGSLVSEPPPPAAPAMSIVRRVFGRFSPFSG